MNEVKQLRKQEDDPTPTESSDIETVLSAVDVSSDQEVVHRLKLPELVRQKYETPETGNKLPILPESDKTESAETSGFSEITEVRKAEQTRGCYDDV